MLIEIGPDAVLVPMTGERTALASCRRDRSEVATALAALGSAHAHGTTVDWAAVLPGRTQVDLPTYAFQRRTYWLAAPPPSGAGMDGLEHPVLSGAVELPGSGGVLLTGRLSPSADPWLADHAVYDTVLFPGTGFLELSSSAAAQVGAGGGHRPRPRSAPGPARQRRGRTGMGGARRGRGVPRLRHPLP
ncbi:hypothetical protein SANTM175S_10926 [Streptomyces antimycoticus]